jgi:hypothetical protein
MPLFRLSPTLINNKKASFKNYLEIAFKDEKQKIEEILEMVL